MWGMDTHVLSFLKAMLIGFSVAAPVGAMGMLVITRTIERGWFAGWCTGLGIALGDAVYGAIGAWGVSSLIAWLTWMRPILSLCGGAVLLWMAWTTWRTPVSEIRPEAAMADTARTRGEKGAFMTGVRWCIASVGLTLTNPATILSFIAVFSAFGAVRGSVAPGWLVLGITLGSLSWWVCLCTAVAWVRHMLTLRWRQFINRVSAALVATFAIMQWASLLTSPS